MFYLENEGQGYGGENWTCAIRVELFDSVLAIFHGILATGQRACIKRNTLPHFYSDRYVGTAKGTICITYFLKTNYLSHISSSEFTILRRANELSTSRSGAGSNIY